MVVSNLGRDCGQAQTKQVAVGLSPVDAIASPSQQICLRHDIPSDVGMTFYCFTRSQTFEFPNIRQAVEDENSAIRQLG